MGNYKCLHTISNAHDDWIKKVQCLSNNRILSYADDKKIKIWKRDYPYCNEPNKIVGCYKQANSFYLR